MFLSAYPILPWLIRSSICNQGFTATIMGPYIVKCEVPTLLVGEGLASQHNLNCHLFHEKFNQNIDRFHIEELIMDSMRFRTCSLILGSTLLKLTRSEKEVPTSQTKPKSDECILGEENRILRLKCICSY